MLTCVTPNCHVIWAKNSQRIPFNCTCSFKVNECNYSLIVPVNIIFASNVTSLHDSILCILYSPLGWNRTWHFTYCSLLPSIKLECPIIKKWNNKIKMAHLILLINLHCHFRNCLTKIFDQSWETTFAKGSCLCGFWELVTK